MAGVMRRFMSWILPTDITGTDGAEGHAGTYGGGQGCGENTMWG